MELLQLIRLPLDPLHLLCQPLAELDPGWGRAGAQDTRLEIAAPIGAVAAREEGLIGALGRGECRAAARPRLAPATPNKRGVDATREGSNEGFGEGVPGGGSRRTWPWYDFSRSWTNRCAHGAHARLGARPRVGRGPRAGLTEVRLRVTPS